MTLETAHYPGLIDEADLQLLDATGDGGPLSKSDTCTSIAGLFQTPESLTTGDDPMTSHAEAGDPAAESHPCAECGKHFARQCDLNKHAKSHSRPFKCSIPSCKYHALGWPTAKELDRHVNDKHAICPRTFSCRFDGCSYQSKRESNCKQHMEKKHNWHYERSKFNGRRASSPALTLPIKQEHTPYLSPASPHPHDFGNDAAGMDFVLFDDLDKSIGVDDDELDERLLPDQSQTYLPWDSPVTRLRNNETFLRRFSQTYDTSSTKADPAQTLIDPRLSGMMQLDVSMARRPGGTSLFPSAGSIVISGQALADAGVKTEFSGANQFSPKRKRDRGFLEVPAGSMNALAARSRHAVAGAPAQSNQTIRSQTKPFSRAHDDSDEEDTPRPKKKAKHMPLESFSDNDMPDIFRFAHPDIYDRDQKEKYSPCHSPHKDISTLVRHLSRPAHRLNVTDRSISSFDLDDEYIHPRVALCRRCWESFSVKQDFTDHLELDCDKVSKGKREKWRILHSTFTPIVGASNEPSRMASTAAAGDVLESPASRSTSAPTTIELGALAPFRPHDNQQHVPIEQHQQLQRFTLDLLRRHGYMDNQGRPTGGNSAADFARLTNNSLGQNLLTGAIHEVAAQNGFLDTYPGHPPEMAADRESLVGHMDSQSTDVDPQGLMKDVQTLSRANSGISSSSRRSAKLHHVPTSPPPPRLLSEDELESSHQPDSATGDLPTRVPSQPSRHKPTSIPDSGYGTDPKRHSLAQEEIVEQLRQADLAGFGAGAESMAPHHSQQQQQQQPYIEVSPDFDVTSYLTHHHHHHHHHNQQQDRQHSIRPSAIIKPDAAVPGHQAHDAMLTGAGILWSDPFAGVGASQATSQAANLAGLAYGDGSAGVGGMEDAPHDPSSAFDQDTLYHHDGAFRSPGELDLDHEFP